ncbi:MAG: efflux RND transporter permease subunit [Rhodomicrobium sp.]
MTSYNLSKWAIEHRSFVWFLMIVAAIAGLMAYNKLGREEDPSFTIKTMVIQQQWPGATILDTINLVTDPIEKELQQIDSVDYTKSYTTPGQATIFVNLKDSTKDVAWQFYQVRKHVQDIQYLLPSSVRSPAFNDEFGDVFGNIYAFTADGLSLRQLRDYVEYVRSEISTVPSLGKVQLIGAQNETIFLDFSVRKLAALGVDLNDLVKTLQNQNSVQPSGVMQAGPERVSLRVTGGFASEKSLRAINLRVNDRYFRLSDVAEISRGYEDPPQALFRYNGQPAIGLAIAARKNANVLQFGDDLKKRMQEIVADLPIGVGIHLVSDQPRVVAEAVSGFTEALAEAVIIVLAVSFFSLGLRAGLVVSFSIPLVLAIVFVAMHMEGISLQRISLGGLIIALGLLVDDAMITVEMMISRLEAGDNLKDAATFAYHSTAFPMLTGTLVTVAGFIPIGLNGSQAGEYTYSLFVVIASALLISWIVAVVFAPLIGVTMLPKSLSRHDPANPSRLVRLFERLLTSAMHRRWLTVGTCAALLAASVFGMNFVQQQFFPSSDRLELLVDLTLPQNSTILETKAQMDRFEKTLEGDPDIERWSSYVGQGAVRFYLPLDQQLSNAFYGQIVVVTKSPKARARVEQKLESLARQEFVGTDVFVQPLPLGPPVGRPVQYRVSGPDAGVVRELALKLANIMGTNSHLDAPTFDWNEPARVLRVDVAQDKARQLGISSETVASILNGVTGGMSITQVRDSIYLINVVGRTQAGERDTLETLQTMQIPTQGGGAVPLLSFAAIRYGLEQPIVWRRDRRPTVTVRASVNDTVQPATIVSQLASEISKFRRALQPGYTLAVGGTVEESGKGEAPIIAVVPAMLLIMAFFIMVQLQSFQKLLLVVSVAPLGLIGVVIALLSSGKPLGFVAILGVLALIGIIIRNSIILVAQIDEMRRDGLAPWAAVVAATKHRMRPILLTASAASLGMIPIASQVFWAPMAYAMIGGIFAATFLTLFFLPALYVGWYGIRDPACSKGEKSRVPDKEAVSAIT